MLYRLSGHRVAVLFVAILTSGISCLGCGYRPLLPMASGVGGSASAETARSHGTPIRLAVMTLRNDSPEPWLDRILTDALRRELEARGSLSLVNDPKGADMVLQGRVLPLYIQSRSFSSFVAALEYSVTIELDVEVARAGGEVVRLDPTMLSETDVYLASADIETTRTHKLEALRRLADLLASRIADSIELIGRPVEVPAEGA